ncbi:hypothetical protein CSUI_007984 [Cystoisospora suis]|uniref:Uncharacterized protein n=1 Tax=Cystoisospora suis TaxID=483139 RepID=A0A2C6KBH9_9APIC|nr:hypothetical protein CSUI_007984 [Cystoisospora suis]
MIISTIFRSFCIFPSIPPSSFFFSCSLTPSLTTRPRFSGRERPPLPSRSLNSSSTALFGWLNLSIYLSLSRSTSRIPRSEKGLLIIRLFRFILSSFFPTTIKTTLAGHFSHFSFSPG